MIKFDIWSNKFAATNKANREKKTREKNRWKQLSFRISHSHTHRQIDRQTDIQSQGFLYLKVGLLIIK